ncbi:MAG: KH domain-containing protein [Candidatus Nomurabacteria bacterium]|jgi:predicted RNA-binding protein YlqC (UPF0109 family)|nr:KH domain-containing protein [Candidatus Nomurabacteria bacterium]
MSSIDQQFIEYIVKTLVADPDKVEVQRDIDEKGVLLTLTVAPEDLGRVIGRRGVTAQSLRTLLRALGTKNDARYNLKIVNNDGYVKPERSEESAGDEPEDAPESAEEEPAEEGAVAEEPAEEVEEDETVEKDSDFAEKTKKELEDLDDLDI